MSKYGKKNNVRYTSGNTWHITVAHSDWNEAIPVGESEYNADRILELLQAQENRIAELEAERDDYKARYEEAMLDGVDETTAPDTAECPVCKGKGKLIDRFAPILHEFDCYECDGTGTIDTHGSYEQLMAIAKMERKESVLAQLKRQSGRYAIIENAIDDWNIWDFKKQWWCYSYSLTGQQAQEQLELLKAQDTHASVQAEHAQKRADELNTDNKDDNNQ